MFLPHAAEVMYNLKMVIPFMYTMFIRIFPYDGFIPGCLNIP